jgi:hypothetical protein
MIHPVGLTSPDPSSFTDAKVSLASASAAGGKKPDLVLPRIARLPVPARPHAAATPHHLSKKLPRPPDAYRTVAVERGQRAFTYHLRRRRPPPALLLAHRAPDTRGRWWVEHVCFPPPDTAVLFDHFTHPLARGRGLYLQAICRLLHDARGSGRRPPGLCHFRLKRPIAARDRKSGIPAVRFQHEGSLFKERRLVWSRPYAVSAGGPFPTALL